MPETLLTTSRVQLFGRVLADIEFTYVNVPDPSTGTRDSEPPRLGETAFLERQMMADEGDEARRPRLARIYAFSYEGHFYDLAKPAIFLVHGLGTTVEGRWLGSGEADDDRWSRTPPGSGRIGVAATPSSFAQDMRVWIYDKGDFSIRMDSETGPLEQILLDAELSSERLRTYFAGSKVRLRGPGRGGSSGE